MTTKLATLLKRAPKKALAKKTPVTNKKAQKKDVKKDLAKPTMSSKCLSAVHR